MVANGRRSFRKVEASTRNDTDSAPGRPRDLDGKRGPCIYARQPEMMSRLSLLLRLFACALCLPMAHGTERVGEATYLYELERYAGAVTGLEQEFLSLIEAASGKERFDLYWTYNHLTGAWVPIDFLQTLLKLSIAASSYSDEEKTRTTLRDQAQFALWELDHTITDLERNIPELRRPNELRIDEALRSLLSEIRTTVDGLLADQCARTLCM